MAVLDGINVHAPLFISGRLMAAYAVPDSGTFHVHAFERDAEDRVHYRYVIEDANGNELESGDDLRSGVGAPVDYPATMATLLSFLMAAAESYPDGESANLFQPNTVEWAALNDDELSMARLEIDPEEFQQD